MYFGSKWEKNDPLGPFFFLPKLARKFYLIFFKPSYKVAIFFTKKKKTFQNSCNKVHAKNLWDQTHIELAEKVSARVQI